MRKKYINFIETYTINTPPTDYEFILMTLYYK